MKSIIEIIGCNKREGAEGSFCLNCNMNHTITEELLKQKAIEWINYYKNYGVADVMGEKWTKIEALAEFVGLTEKDLE